MNKPVSVFLEIARGDAFWLGMVNFFETTTVYRIGSKLVAILRVKSYSLVDHQFIQIKANDTAGKEILQWIPRSIVKTIIEGRIDTIPSFPPGKKIK